MRNSFLINIILLVCINVLIKPAYIFAIEIPVQNLVGNNVYGMYFTFLNLAYIFQLVSDLGLQNMSQTDLPRKKVSFPVLFSNLITLRLFLGVLYMLVISTAGALLGYWALDATLLFIVTFNVLLVSTLQFIRANITGLGMYMKDSLLSVADKGIMLVMLAYMLYMAPDRSFSIYTFASVQTISYLIAIVAGLLLLKSRIQWVSPSISLMRSYLVRALPFGIVIVLMFLYTRVDAIMIEKMLSDGLEQAGYYASAYRLYDAASMITLLFANLLLPMFSELDHDKKGRTGLYYGSFSMIAALALLVALPVYSLSDQIMNVLYTDTSSDSIWSLSILMVAFVWKSTLFVTSTLLTSARIFKSMILLFCSSILLNILANLYLIPKEGIVGASVSTMITQLYVALGCMYLCHRHGMISFMPGSYLKLFGYMLLCVVVIGGLHYLSDDSMNLISVIVATMALGVVYILLNYKKIYQLSRPLGGQ